MVQGKEFHILTEASGLARESAFGEDDSSGVVGSSPDVVKKSTRRSTKSARRVSNASGISGHHNHHHPHIKHYVQHNYHDHSRDPIVLGEQVQTPEADVASEKPTSAAHKRRGHRGGVSTPFPEKLHEMLTALDAEGDTSIVSWQPHGRCFVVHDPKHFVEDVMPSWFRQSKLTSFQRQLNLYGFSRLTAGTDRGGYYHELFLKNRPDLCQRMVRTRIKGNGSKAAASPETEPNFYQMDPLPASVPTTTPGAPVVVAPTSKRQRTYVLRTSSKKQELIVDEAEEEEQLNEILSSGEDVILPQDTLVPTTNTAKMDQQLEEEENGRFTPTTSTAIISTTSDGVAALSPISSYSSMQAALPDGAAMVTPMAEPRPTASIPEGLASLAPPLSGKVVGLGSFLQSKQQPTEQEEECDGTVHSGDRILFEGLPFHYLETKDVEDSLHILHAAEV